MLHTIKAALKREVTLFVLSASVLLLFVAVLLIETRRVRNRD